MQRRIALALVAAIVLLVPASVASAGQNDVIRRGSCTGGSFTVRIVEVDHAGSDAFMAKARNLSTDEGCVGHASF